MRFLVTGGAGFIGSHIVERLLKEGHSVCVLDNFSSGKKENLSFISDFNKPPTIDHRLSTNNHRPSTIDYRLINGDIRDAATCERACDGIDYVLHQAALRSVPKSMSRPHEYNEVNIDGTVNVLQAALKQKVRRVVLASSSSVYGDVSKFPQEETDMPLLISPYALTKLAAEYYSRVFSENYGLETVNLRYFNVFGPKQSLDDEYAVVIPKFIHCMLNNEQPPIHGDGTQSRDFTYVDNVVEANILAATAPQPVIPAKAGIHKTFCEVFNVAVGDDHSVLDLAESLNTIIGKNIKPTHTPPRAGDVKRTCADIRKISMLLNFEPKVNFEDGLRKTVEWFAKNLNPAKA